MGERGGGNQNTILSLFGFFGHLLSKRHRKYEECQLSAGAVFGAKRARCSARGGSRDTYSRNPSVIHGTGSPLTGAGVCFSHGSQSRFRCRHSYMSLHLFSRCVSVVLARAQSICFGEELRRDIVSVVLARAQSICFGEELRCDIIPMAFKRRAC